MKASTELDNILNISKYKYSKKDDGRHPFAKAGWEYYETVFQVGNKSYTGLLNVANDGNKKMLYDITNIKEMSSNNSIKTASSANPSLKYSIPSSDGTVNNQYMQNNEKNSQGLENYSSFSLPENINLKKKQLEIIQKENPAPDDYHTWIRSQDDIKTFDEVINDDESFVWGDFNKEDAKRALENGYVTIYSSQPIKIISYQNVVGNYNYAKPLRYDEWIISYQNVVGNYN